jgi:hypothetical protein
VQDFLCLVRIILDREPMVAFSGADDELHSGKLVLLSQIKAFTNIDATDFSMTVEGHRAPMHLEDWTEKGQFKR